MHLKEFADGIEMSVNSDIRTWFYDRPPRIEHYVTQAGVEKIFINPFLIWEFPTVSQAVVVGYYRFVFADLCRILHVLMYLRFTLPFFGIRVMDGGWVQAFWELTSLYTNRFVGVLPTIGGVDLGFIFAFYFIDRLDTLVTSIIILSASGQRF